MSLKQKRHLSEEALLKSLGNLEERAQEADELEQMTSEVETRVSKGGKVTKAKKGFPFKKPAPTDEASEEESNEEGSEEEGSEDISKSHTANEPGMPDDTSEADGGLADEAGARAKEFPSIRSQDSKPTAKSLRERMLASEQVKKGFEISEFLEAVTDTQVEAFDELSKSFGGFVAEQRAFNKKIAKALVALGGLLTARDDEQEEAEENAPVGGPRAVRKSLDDGRPVERFEKGNGGAQYTREQTLDVLVSLAEQGKVDVLLPSVYESTGVIPQEHIGTVNSALAKSFPKA